MRKWCQTASLYTLKNGGEDVVKEDVGFVFGNFSGARKLLNFMGVASDGWNCWSSGSVIFHMWWIHSCVRFPKRIFCFRISELLPKNGAEIRRNSDVGKILWFLQIGSLKMHGHAAPCTSQIDFFSYLEPNIHWSVWFVRDHAFGPRKIDAWTSMKMGFTWFYLMARK